LPLFIHTDPKQPLLLNKTCRYCAHCDLLIAHQNELDEIITRTFTILNPKIVDNKYLVIGTLDRTDWKRIDHNKLPIQDTIVVLYDFKEVVIFKPMSGWRR
jgi:thioredoxin-related protein